MEKSDIKKNLDMINNFLLENKGDIFLLQRCLIDENDETYQGLLKERKDLTEIKLWLENKLENNLVISN
jgi:hypothetical protein